MRLSFLTVLLLMFSPCGFAHTIPDDVMVQAFGKSDSGRFHLLVRVPFDALADTVFPLRENGELDLDQVNPMLPGVARIWIAEWIAVYQSGKALPKPQVIAARVSPVTDRSFASYDEAWRHLTGPALPVTAEILPSRAMFDVLLDCPIRGGWGDFAIHSRLARLGGRVVTSFEFVRPGTPAVTYGFVGDPGLFTLAPRWGQSVRRFVPTGLLEILKGSDYLLFLLCIALRFRHISQLVPFLMAFSAGHAITLIAAAYGFAPEALWFPIAFESIIALSIVYMAFESIWPSHRSLLLTAFAFGLAHGFGLAVALRPVLQFGGSHVLASTLSFYAGAVSSEVFVLALLNHMLRLVFMAGVPGRIGTIFFEGIAAHTGWHRMVDRAKWLSTFSLDPGSMATVGRWLIGALVVACAAYFIKGFLRPRWLNDAQIDENSLKNLSP